MSTLLGYTAVHAACVVIKDRAVLFCGKSGAGKSTLAAYFDAKDYTVLSDDVSYVKAAGGILHVYPSVPKMKIDNATFNLLGRAEQGLRSLPGSRNRSLLPVKGNYEQLSYRLQAVVFLDFNNQETAIHQINKLVSTKKLQPYLFRKGLLKSLCSNGIVQGMRHYFSIIPMFTFSRINDFSQTMENLLIAEHKFNQIISQAQLPFTFNEV
jgi:hypothetical protein